jgi:hypothetical protein
MENCEECGLPKKVCAAVSMYRKALSAYEAGDLAEAHRCADDAALLIKEYKAQRSQLQPVELTDEERIRLSGFF